MILLSLLPSSLSSIVPPNYYRRTRRAFVVYLVVAVGSGVAAWLFAAVRGRDYAHIGWILAFAGLVGLCLVFAKDKNVMDGLQALSGRLGTAWRMTVGSEPTLAGGVAADGDPELNRVLGNDGPELGAPQLPLIECAITFLPTEDGGRRVPFPRGAMTGDAYRPHLVVGDPTQRRAVVVDGRSIEEYIGVSFHDGPSLVEADVEAVMILCLMYFPHPMYNTLQPGVTFTVREGPQVVGYGTVRHRLPV